MCSPPCLCVSLCHVCFRARGLRIKPSSSQRHKQHNITASSNRMRHHPLARKKRGESKARVAQEQNTLKVHLWGYEAERQRQHEKARALVSELQFPPFNPHFQVLKASVQLVQLRFLHGFEQSYPFWVVVIGTDRLRKPVQNVKQDPHCQSSSISAKTTAVIMVPLSKVSSSFKEVLLNRLNSPSLSNNTVLNNGKKGAFEEKYDVKHHLTFDKLDMKCAE